MRKYDSILKLHSWGLNTPRSCQPSPEWLDEIGDIAAISWLREALGEPPWSIRTEKPDSNMGTFPFFYGMESMTKVLLKVRELMRGGYDVMISETLDKSLTLACGTLAVPEEDPPYVEFILGPHTVREMGEQKVYTVDLFSLADCGVEGDISNLMCEVVNEVPLGNIYEWSLLYEPKGILDQKGIWWEVRPYSEHPRR